MIREFFLRLMGYGELDCPRCGAHFFTTDGKGVIWDTPNGGRVTCCPGETRAYVAAEALQNDD